MTIQEVKKHLKENKITYQELSDSSGIALNTLKSIFCGRTPTPRIDTMQAIERALGLDKEKKSSKNELSEDEKQIIEIINDMSDEEWSQVVNYINFLKSQRK